MISHSLPENVLKILVSIEDLGFSLCMVGGITRDYFYAQSLGSDYDIEIRPAFGIVVSAADWPLYYQKLHQFFQKHNIEYKEFPYLITRIKVGEAFLEFSSPREEENIPENTTHHHFVAHLAPDIAFDKSFRRRDFTMNAIGIALNFKEQSETIVDPFSGLVDLKNKKIRHVSDDFFFDSVRFLRLIRFSLRFKDFAIEESLLSRLSLFDLSALSVYHFCEELFKSSPGPFLNSFSTLIKTYSIKVNEQFKLWSEFHFPDNVSTKDEILAHVYLTAPEKAGLILKFFAMPEKKLKDLQSYKRSLVFLGQLVDEDFKALLSIDKEQALNNPILKEMKNLEDKKEWSWIISREKIQLRVGYEDWQSIKIDETEILGLDPQYRSLLRFYKALGKKFNYD